MPTSYDLHAHALGIRAESGACAEVPWREIVEIAVHRLDLITRQPLVLELVHESGHVWEVFSDEPGWQPLVAHLLQRHGLEAERVLPRLAALNPDDEPVVLHRR